MLRDFKIDHTLQIDYNNQSNLLILISLLHINGFINDKSINALFKSLKAGKLYRNVNTYHSRINDKWYNDENIFEIYSDIFETMINPKDPKIRLKLERINKMRKINGLPPKTYKRCLTFEETIKYLNRYLNRSRNYCIDYLYFEYIKPMILKFEYGYSTLSNMFNYDFSDLEKSYTYFGSYCCEDCDGPYDRHLEYVDYQRNKAIKEKIVKLISEFLNTKREKYKGSYKEYTL